MENLFIYLFGGKLMKSHYENFVTLIYDYSRIVGSDVVCKERGISGRWGHATA